MLKGFLAIGLILFATCGWSAVKTGTTLENGLVAHWTMDEVNGTTLLDSSGNGNNGLITGAASTGGKIGKCLYFDGINDSVVIQPSDSLALLGNFTVNIWVKSSSDDYGGRIISKRGAVVVFDLHINTMDTFVDYYVSGQTPVFVSSVLDWNMITIRFRDGFRSYWVNGIRELTDYPYTSVVSSDPITIGNWAYPFGGYIDDTRIYDRALSDDEIVSLYRSLAVLPTNFGLIPLSESKPVYEGLSTNGLVALWKLDENIWNGTVGEVKDGSGNGYDGTTFGGAFSNPGKINRSGIFNGSTAYLEFPHIAMQNVSVSLWLKTTLNNPLPQFLINRDATSAPSYGRVWQLYLTSGRVCFTPFNDSGLYATVSSTSTVGDGNWHNVVVSYSDGFISMWVDGKLEAGPISFSGYLNPSVAIFLIGFPNEMTGGLPWDGQIDDMRVYNRAITSNEVAQINNAELLSKKPVAVYQGTKLVFNPAKKSYVQDSFDPLSIDGCVMWLDGKDISTFTIDDNRKVTEWRDKSQSGITAANADPSLNPLYTGNGVLTSYGHTLSFGAISTKFGNKRATAIIYFWADNDTDGYSILWVGDDWTVWTDGGSYFHKFREARLSASWNIPSDGRMIITTRANEMSPLYKVNLNDTNVFTDESAFTFANVPIILTPIWYPGQNLKGIIYEVIMYDRDISDAELKQVTDYLVKKWSIAY